MPRPTDTALRSRARALLEAMTERCRWIYAVPRELGAEAVRPIALAAGLRAIEEEGSAARFSNERESANLVVFDSPELEVMFHRGLGRRRAADPRGHPRKNELLRAVHAARHRARRARRGGRQGAPHAGAHGRGLGRGLERSLPLHLAAPDPVARHEATLALTVAVMVARDAGPAPALLEEAMKREKFPKLKDTMSEALNVVRGVTGGPVEIKPDA
jgi:hypothetical protein